MQNFILSFPTRVVFGSGVVESVGREAAGCGRHALLVTGTTFGQRSGLIDRIKQSLGDHDICVTVYDGAGLNPRVDQIDEGGRLARDSGADFVLGLGGGSALDAAKTIAVTAVSGRSIWESARHGWDHEPVPVEGALPIVQVPIIASTGSETNDSAVVFDEPSRLKSPIKSPHLYARVAVVDPTLTFTVPPEFTAIGGMNIVSQMLESYLTRDEFPVSDRITEGLMRVVMDSLPRAMRRGEDLDARTNLSWVAALTSTITEAGQGGFLPLRAMAQPLSAHFNVMHGTALAALWPSYMRYALSNRYRLPQIGRFKRFALLGRQIFGVHETDDEVAAETTMYRLVNWLRGLGMPTDLRQIGVESETFGQLADQVVLVAGHGKRLPGGLSVEDIEHIYEGALRPA